MGLTFTAVMNILGVSSTRRKMLIFSGARRARQHLGEPLGKLANHKGVEVAEGHLMPDHVHMCLSIPPKYAVSNVVGYIKGRSTISIARQFSGKIRNFIGEQFWARGYFVSTVGLEEEMVRAYIRNQEKEDERQEQLRLGKY